MIELVILTLCFFGTVCLIVLKGDASQAHSLISGFLGYFFGRAASIMQVPPREKGLKGNKESK